MEMRAWLFFSFWAVISITFLRLGFQALEKTELSNTVPPVIMSFFELFLLASSAISITYGLIRRQERTYVVRRNFLRVMLGIHFGLVGFILSWIGIWDYLPYKLAKITWLCYILLSMKTFSRRHNLTVGACFILGLFLPWYVLAVITFILVGLEHYMNPQGTHVAIHVAVKTSMFIVRWENTRSLFFFCIQMLFICFFICALLLVEPAVVESFEEKVGVLVAKLKGKKIGKLIEFAVGMAGALLFQNFFRLTSFSEVVAFLYLAVMWVANLVLLSASYDFGVLRFLLGNVVVGSMVSQFGLRIATWLAYGASLILYSLRLKLESLTLVRRPGEEERVKLW